MAPEIVNTVSEVYCSAHAELGRSILELCREMERSETTDEYHRIRNVLHVFMNTADECLDCCRMAGGMETDDMDPLSIILEELRGALEWVGDDSAGSPIYLLD